MTCSASQRSARRAGWSSCWASARSPRARPPPRPPRASHSRSASRTCATAAPGASHPPPNARRPPPRALMAAQRGAPPTSRCPARARTPAARPAARRPARASRARGPLQTQVTGGDVRGEQVVKVEPANTPGHAEAYLWARGWHCISASGAGPPCSTHAPVAEPLGLTGETPYQARTSERMGRQAVTCYGTAWRQRLCGGRAGGLAALLNKVLQRTRLHAGRVNTALTGTCIKAAAQGVAGSGGHALLTCKQSTASAANLPC